MRTFTSYGSPDTDLHYYAPRQDVIEKAYHLLLGDAPEKGGHYITVWAPGQTGKTWVMLEVLKKFLNNKTFDAAIITMQSAKEVKTDEGILELFVYNLKNWFDKPLPKIRSWQEIPQLFSKEYFSKPVIVMIDEFDAKEEAFINKFANQFREMFTSRKNELDKSTGQKKCLLHGLALIGVRSVLGIENISGSPFNVQRSVHIQNLSPEEVRALFKWYERESGQHVKEDVIDQLYYETNGQPGLTCWFGELLTETYNENTQKPITINEFKNMYSEAVYVLPNTNILNILSKVKHEPYQSLVLDLFKTDEKIDFRFEQERLNYLYMNGIVDIEKTDTGKYVKFASPFVQKKIFNRFSYDIFDYTGKLFQPFEDLSDIITETHLNIRNLMKRYQSYLKDNRDWLLKDAPKRKDLRIFEAVYHFNLYRYIFDFLKRYGVIPYPEFPTGNGKIDLIIKYKDQLYGIEVKSYTNEIAYNDALIQAAQYGRHLGLKEINVVFFVEYVDDKNRKKYESDYNDEKTGVKVMTVFVETGK